MNILVTGGTGFIGSHLCEKLLQLNNTVFCIDNNYTGSKNNIEGLMDNDNFVYVQHDVNKKIIIESPIHQIYHLACPASPPKYQIDPIFTLKTCFIGTLNILELAVAKKATILLTSTSEIYGEPLISPQNEDYRGNVNTLGIRSCYDEGKRIAETLLMDFHRKYDLDIRIARIFNTYGPKMDIEDGRVVSNFINQALNNIDITIYGKGLQTRSFCYIDDQIDGLIKLMASNYIGPINIGSPNELTIKELSEIILKLTGSSSRVIFQELPSDDPTNRKPDISLANKILDWNPKYELEEGLNKTIDYFTDIYLHY